MTLRALISKIHCRLSASRKELESSMYNNNNSSWSRQVGILAFIDIYFDGKAQYKLGKIICFINLVDINDVNYIWNNSYLNCGCRWKWRMTIADNFPIYAIGKKPGIRICDLRDTGAMLYQLSLEATHWERGQCNEFISHMRSEMMWIIYDIIHIWTAVADESEERSFFFPIA